jgi:hypothetical protein
LIVPAVIQDELSAVATNGCSFGSVALSVPLSSLPASATSFSKLRVRQSEFGSLNTTYLKGSSGMGTVLDHRPRRPRQAHCPAPNREKSPSPYAGSSPGRRSSGPLPPAAPSGRPDRLRPCTAGPSDRNGTVRGSRGCRRRRHRERRGLRARPWLMSGHLGRRDVAGFVLEGRMGGPQRACQRTFIRPR